jgi:hypothetical protein
VNKKELLEKVEKMELAVSNLKELIPSVNMKHYIAITYLEFELDNIKKDLLNNKERK